MLFNLSVKSMARFLVMSFLVGLALDLAFMSTADARAGRGRSSGKSSGFNRPSQSQQYQKKETPSSNQQAVNPAQSQRGGFMRSLAGGLAGGLIGGMLFSSLGHAFGGSGGSGGGIGFLDIILIAGLAYLAFRWWKSRQRPLAVNTQGGLGYQSNPLSGQTPFGNPVEKVGSDQSLLIPGQTPWSSSPRANLDQDEASDLFFKIQAAWTRRDLSLVRAYLNDEMAKILEQDLDELRVEKRINRLENISIRNVVVSDSWQENESRYCNVRFTANLLDYIVDEKTGQIVSGSDVDPIKFEEDWIFVKTSEHQKWQLAGIEQV